MELVIFIGLQASGKSSFRRERLAAHVCVSKDDWPNAKRRDDRQRRLVAEALSAGRSVVMDNTNARRADRAPLIALGREAGAEVVSFFWFS
jgi:predicted kinase